MHPMAGERQEIHQHSGWLIPAGFGIEVALTISVPGMERASAEALVAKAHEVCPYSNATRGNIDVTLTVA